MKETGYLLQAALIAVWWLGLGMSPWFFAAFQFEGISELTFWGFLFPDLLLITGLSVVRGYYAATALEWVILGAFGYATLYCVNITLLTGSGYLPSTLMLLGLAFNGLLCANRSLFRNASSHLLGNALKTLVQIICMWTILLVAIPAVILEAFDAFRWPAGGWPLWLGGILFGCCSLLGLSSAYVMVRDGQGTPLPLDQTNRLVVSGPYAYLRNPMAVAGLGQGLAVALITQSVPVLVYVAIGALLWQVVVRPMEERDLSERFGDSYRCYCQEISCWIPRFRRIHRPLGPAVGIDAGGKTNGSSLPEQGTHSRKLK